MNSETFGIFGPRGLLSKMEAEEHSNPPHQCLTHVAVTTVDQSNSDDMPVVPERKETSEQYHQLKNALQNLSANSEPSLTIPFIPLSDLPPIDAVFSIEKISRAIFSLLEPSDLLRCRLVSSSWLEMATNDKLLNWRKNKICITYNYYDFEASGLWGSSITRPFKGLTDTFDGIGLHSFPCSAFRIADLTIPQIDLLKFFHRYGFLIKYFHIMLPRYDLKQGQTIVYSKKSLFEFVTKLLSEEMPNLETLTVKFRCDPEIKGEIDPLLLISIKEGLLHSTLTLTLKQNHNLRKIKFCETMPYEIIETVCCLAPKVERLIQRDLGFWVEHKHRLYLLKELKLTPETNNFEIESIIGDLNKLELQKLKVNFLSCTSAPEMWAGKAELLKRILDLCFHSLEELHLSPFPFLQGQVFPRMPKVKVLQLTSIGATPELSLLPLGTSIVTTFPNLHTVSYHSFHDKMRALSGSISFLYWIKHEKISSVKSLRVSGCGFDSTIFQEHFPNAAITMRK